MLHRTVSLRLLVAGLLVFNVTVMLTATLANAAQQTVSLNPIADVHVESRHANTNYGSQDYLEVDGSPLQVVYLKFDLTDLSPRDAVDSALLSIRITNRSRSEQVVRIVDDVSWNEDSMTYDTKPSVSTAITSLSHSTVGQTVVLDLTSYARSKAGQVLSVAFDSIGGDGLDFASREAAVLERPVLDIIYTDDQTLPSQAEAPVFAPAGGTYQDPVDVSMESATAGASIHYTTDGSSPNTGSALYASPITLTSDTTIKAMAVAAGYTDSAVTTGSYIVQATPDQVQTPVLTPASGTYQNSVDVSMDSATVGADIYYTTDGATPDRSSNRYLAPVTLISDTTVKAMATATGLTDSTVTEADYVVEITPTQVEAPVFAPPSGTYRDSVDVTMNSATSGADIYYTTDGTTPDTRSTHYAGSVTLSTDTTVNAVAIASGLTNSAVTTADYVIQVTPPPPAGGSLVVSAADIGSCSGSGDEETGALLDTIFSTESGIVTIPGDIALPDGTTENFVCFHSSWGAHKPYTYPALGNHEYHIEGAPGYFEYFGERAGDPTEGYYSFDIDSNWHAVSLNSNCNEIGGCDAGSAQEQWLRSDLAANADKNTLAYWHHPRYAHNKYSDYTRVDDLWDALYEYGAEIVLNGHEHIYERYQPLDANDSVDNAYGIREFIVGTGGKSITSEMRPPSPTSVTRNLSDLGVLKLYLQADGYSWEFVPVAGGSYADSGSSSVHSAPSQLVTQAPVLSPGSGVYAESVSVTMSSSTPGASIYYTIDGTVPDTNSTLYAGAITLTSTTTVKAMAAAAGLADSTVTTGDYVVQSAPTQTEAPIFTPASGTYQDSVSVAIISSTPGASIYYTTDGTVPDTNSTLYAGAIVLTSDTTVKALATAGGLIDSRVATALYTIQTGGGQSATIVLEPIADTYVKANRATSNYGARDWLEIDGYSVKISYLKFDLSSIPAGSTVTSAVLKLTVIDSSISTQVVKLVDDSSWEELLLTYENRPTGSTLLASIPGASVGDVISISLTNIVNTEQGSLFSLLIDSDGSNGLDVSSRDAAAGRPVLEITYE